MSSSVGTTTVDRAKSRGGEGEDARAVSGWGQSVVRRRFSGSYVQAVDDKHRVSIPSRFRDILIANTDPDMMKEGPFALIGLHPEFPCLIGYDAGWADEEHARVPEAGEETKPYFNRMQGLGEGDELRFDGTGRVTLAPYQRREVGIGKHAYFRAAYNHFEIWDPQTFVDHPGVNERAKIACRGIMTDKGLW